MPWAKTPIVLLWEFADMEVSHFKLKIIYQYIGRKFPICLILTLFFPIEWVPVPVPMGRKKKRISVSDFLALEDQDHIGNLYS